MSPCDPLDLSFDLPTQPPGIGVPQFAVSLPAFPGLDLPDFTDLLGLLDKFLMLLPSGLMKPGLSINFGKDAFDAILSLLEKFMPFLMLYNFLLPLLNIIPCIIDVLCAIPIPFKLVPALRRLFRKCLPLFLNLFPFLALILMILALIALIIAIVEYIIKQIAKIIKKIIKNILILAKAIGRLSAADNGKSPPTEDTVLAAIRKISGLLCFLQQLFVIFGLVAAIIEVIKAIASTKVKIPPCGGDQSDNFPNDLDPDLNCCTADVCPHFLKQETHVGTSGVLKYFGEVGLNASLPVNFFPPGFNLSLPPVRQEIWQFYDPFKTQEEYLYNITSPSDSPSSDPFFPSTSVFTGNTPPKKAPYTLDIDINYNPYDFWKIPDPNNAGQFINGPRLDDKNGLRVLKIKNCIVLETPLNYITNADGTTTPVPSGVLHIAGGSVFEENGIPVFINGLPAKMTDVISRASTYTITTPTLSKSDSVDFTGIPYTFNINHAVLAGAQLITIGCIPSLANDKNFVNVALAQNLEGNTALLNSLLNGPDFPDPNKTKDCVFNALDAIQKNISVQSMTAFQLTAEECLNDLKNKCLTSFVKLVDIGFDPNKSSFTIDPSLQFTTKPIKVSVNLNDATGQSLVQSATDSTALEIAKNIQPIATLGQVGNFTFVGGQFVADLTSKVAGKGNIKIAYSNKIISTINDLEDLSKDPSITEVVLDYQFIEVPVSEEGKPRRDEHDVAGDSVGTNNG